MNVEKDCVNSSEFVSFVPDCGRSLVGTTAYTVSYSCLILLLLLSNFSYKGPCYLKPPVKVHVRIIFISHIF